MRSPGPGRALRSVGDYSAEDELLGDDVHHHHRRGHHRPRVTRVSRLATDGAPGGGVRRYTRNGRERREPAARPGGHDRCLPAAQGGRIHGSRPIRSCTRRRRLVCRGAALGGSPQQVETRRSFRRRQAAETSSWSWPFIGFADVVAVRGWMSARGLRLARVLVLINLSAKTMTTTRTRYSAPRTDERGP